MTFTSARLALLLTLIVLGGISGARSDELVRVAPHRSVSGSHSSDSTPPLLGFLARPIGPGRFPAVVLLHGCIGFDGHDTAAATMLKDWGYVALALDSLGDANTCRDRDGDGMLAEAFDAYAGLRYLATQTFVASGRVAVMGYSMGGTAALAVGDQTWIVRAERGSFRAMIAYYPACEFSTGTLTAPALILIGEKDDWHHADACRKLAAHESDIGVPRDGASGTPLDLVVYPDATHAFDYRVSTQRYLGYLIQYNEAAAGDAEAQVRAFLRRVLGDQPDPVDRLGNGIPDPHR